MNTTHPTDCTQAIPSNQTKRASSVLRCTTHAIKLPDIVRGDGHRVYDSEGRQYLDLESGVWCLSLGHGDTAVTNTIIKQVQTIMHTGFCQEHPVLEQAAEKMLEIAGMPMGTCLFLCSGSEAIEVSRQIARTLTHRKRSMTMHDSYLGSYASTIDRSLGWYLFDWRACTTCPHRDACDPDCDAIQNIPDDIAEFTFEPGSSGGAVRFPPSALVRTICERIHANGGYVVANEVTTGIGRTGTWFGFEHYGIQPDMIAAGKGIGNGYPVSVAVLSQRVTDTLACTGFHYSQSHQNDPLGASVAKTVLERIIELDLISHAAQTGAWLLEHLQAMVDGQTITAVRGRGLMLAVDFASGEICGQIHNALLSHGYIAGNRGTSLRIDPPLGITLEELGGFLEALERAVHSA